MPDGPTRRERLELNRDRLAAVLDAGGLDARSMAGIAKELRLTLAELDEMPDASEVDAVDELAARRADPPTAEVPKRAASRRKRGTTGN